jgi:hypothetical protein
MLRFKAVKGADLSDRARCPSCGEALPENSRHEKYSVTCPKCGEERRICHVCGGFVHNPNHVFPRWFYDPVTKNNYYFCCGECGDALEREHPEYIYCGPVDIRDELEGVISCLKDAIDRIEYFIGRAIKQYGEPEQIVADKETLWLEEKE